MIRMAISAGDPLGTAREAIRAGADWIQIREKGLEARDLAAAVRAVLALPDLGGIQVLVNSRVDVALACGAHGAHLPAGEVPPERWRAVTPPGFRIGVSCHTLAEVRRAAAADYVQFGPVFAPLSKSSELAPRGLAGLARAARASRCPVLAVGGITAANLSACVDAGAAGIAAITVFRA
jgi:thiamine-phosphate pyrophosphorylase